MFLSPVSTFSKGVLRSPLLFGRAACNLRVSLTADIRQPWLGERMQNQYFIGAVVVTVGDVPVDVEIGGQALLTLSL
jgi:hypothetical protein